MTSTREAAADGRHDVVMATSEITPEMIEAMTARIGVELRIEHSVHNEEATRLAVAKFAAGVGDTNPLWTDADYAAATRYGERIAPPSWVVSVFAAIQFGWEGLGAFHSASDFRFHVPVRLGDRIEATCRYDGFTGPRPSRFARQTVVDNFTTRYTNQHGTLVADNRWDVVHFERGQVRTQPPNEASGDSPGDSPHPWNPGELAALEERVLAERPRGVEVRWWDDVEVGDRLDPITKGPIGLTDEIAYVVGGGTPIPRFAAHRAALEAYRSHPAWSFRDPDTGALEPIYAVHYNSQAARAMGVARQYDVGFQRQCWQIHLLTDWMGDDGWLVQAASELRKFVHLGDAVELSGTVTDKFVADDGEARVRIETTAHNQRGEPVMPGTAVVALPTRSSDTRPSDRRR